jgi:DNA-binding CsgD family transcriptional regulator
MESMETLLLQLYSAVGEVPAPDFATYALTLMQPVLKYDSARVTVVDTRGAGVLVRGSLLYREPSDMMLDWSAIAAADTVMHDAMRALNTTVTFNASQRFVDKGYAVIRDYAYRYAHRNGAVQITHDNATGLHTGVSLYRAADAAYFTEAERRACQCLIPHLTAAMKLSGLLGRQTAEGSDAAHLAIATVGGCLQYCDPAFEALLRLEWADCRLPHLPKALVDGLSGGAAMRHQGRHAVFTATLVGQRLFLRGRRQFRLEQLAPREREVARLFAGGQSYKEIARRLELAPATVRNTVQRVYQKLSIGSKSQLANMLSAES